ncbi:spermidine synthase, partial [bacterium]|nr:spermidine synthase [bacterium]
LESFLFTREAFEEARDHLAPDGIFVLNNFYWRPWLVERLAAMLEDVFRARPLLRPSEGPNQLAVLAAGPLVASLGEAGPPGESAARAHTESPPCASSDDWPFPYLLGPGVPAHYVLALSVVLASAVALVLGTCRASGLSPGKFSPHFFVLGAAFLLLETKSLVTFSLLFGVTWFVSSLVFFAVLASVLAAILVNAICRFERPAWLYAALAGSLLLGFFLPPGALVLDPPGLRYAIASAVAFAPVFFANLVFTRSFRDSRAADTAFASNLLGAAVGGALEYLSLLTGFRALLLAALGLYALAFLALRFPVLGDREGA